MPMYTPYVPTPPSPHSRVRCYVFTRTAFYREFFFFPASPGRRRPVGKISRPVAGDRRYPVHCSCTVISLLESVGRRAPFGQFRYFHSKLLHTLIFFSKGGDFSFLLGVVLRASFQGSSIINHDGSSQMGIPFFCDWSRLFPV